MCSIFLVVLIITTLLVVAFSKGKEPKQVDYIPYTVGSGETYWHIAKNLQERGYKSAKDIREVVHELATGSGIKAHELREGDVILLPYFFD